MFFKLASDQVVVFQLDCKLKSGYYSSGEGVGVHAKAKRRHKLTPGTLLIFLLTYSLYNHLLESP